MHSAFINNLESMMKAAGLLPIKNQAELNIRILKERLNLILPWAMAESDIDCWLVVSREACKDPMLKTLYPWDMYDVRRVGMLIFCRNNSGEIRRIALGSCSPEMEDIYEQVQNKDEDIWHALSRIIVELNPNKIAVNRNTEDGFCDGLSSTLYENIRETLGDYSKKICDGGPLTVRWLQRVTPLEKQTMKTLVNITHQIVNYAFSKQFIKVGETTTTHIEWFMRDVINRLGYLYWFGPDIDLQRKGSNVARMFNEVILPGDLIHCDVGMNGVYVQLHTDMQWIAYILKDDETQAPEEFISLFKKANKLQDIVMENIKDYTTGNDVLKKSLNKAKNIGINPMIYTHPLGTFGHGSGPRIGQFDNQEFNPIVGERFVEDKTCYALELNVYEKIKIWDDQVVYMFVEEDICKDTTVEFIDGRQEKLMLI
ncbi:M24 family metallopeptidase [Sedimentibacter hydroxybenzoicus DSM 7310]|uniref:M24 family metallopeptidase n=1 Tax=Sedimentibacter hydroxybenzoicus DSM 7310 TaxID=1123245 RepID=A0A974BH40_SEDHY|nr:M24 family metallopeptidase [Sedimentibacter hydroxybenzoicus]NYB73002.1 M24 family metallopeptidase [Sedimentibacter hydroxybenzoicus DSM 7310]